MAYTTIDDPSVYFQTALYTGDGNSTQAITNDGNSNLQPDWIWTKVRSTTNSHHLADTSRGITKQLAANNTNGESTDATIHASVQSDGFTVGNAGSVNADGATYVSWQWKANGGTATGSFNESGNNPGVSFQANTTAGFSICTYTGTGGNGSFAHGLGVVPDWFIIKRRNDTEDWVVYHHKNTSAPETDHLLLNTTDGTSDSDTRFQDTAPTSSSIYIGNNAVVNADASTYVCYAFKSIQGYSKFGGYTGNGAADGTFVYTGFKPSWVMIRNTKNGEGWMLHDSKVEDEGGNGAQGNPVERRFQVNETQAEVGTGDAFDFLSNGFKLRTDTGSHNGSGDSFIYMAFAKSPFVSSEGVPTTAR